MLQEEKVRLEIPLSLCRDRGSVFDVQELVVLYWGFLK